MKIGLLIIATNKYIRFLQPLITSADKFLLKNQEVTYFVFTNEDVELFTERNVVKINVEHKDWPWMTLGRYKIFNESRKELSEMDYLFYSDADMKFVSEVGDEIISERVATQHPGFYGSKGTPETNPNSLAYIDPNDQNQYFAGGFNGGTSEEYLKMAKNLADNIDIDFKNGIIAKWHDESHMNRYFFDNTPTKILNPSYCYGESMNIPFDKKLIALDKNHEEVRN
tara:strand:+ start:17491 stop:18168 length:678 start_codon:yes stop_codon:yes gene_type:complete